MAIDTAAVPKAAEASGLGPCVVVCSLTGICIEEAGTLCWEHVNPKGGSMVPRRKP
jgi:hypothetical protein